MYNHQYQGVSKNRQQHRLFYSSKFCILCFLLLIDIAVSADDVSDFLCDNDEHKCLNGGTCVEGISKGTGKFIQVCDCQDAIDEDGNRYVGLYCEVKTPTKGDQYCVNGGTPHTISSGVIRCNCPVEYTGTYCELARNSTEIKALMDNSNDGEVGGSSHNKAECSMECMNGGRCAIGRREPTPAENDLYPNFDPNVVTFFYEHCRCPEGFYGSQCEKSYEVCKVHGDDNGDEKNHFYCHNGASCVYTKVETVASLRMATDSKIDSPPQYDIMCNCTAAHRPGKHFTGEFCEFENLVTCDQNDDGSHRQFCTNGGTCQKDRKKGHWFCDCPKGYGGEHCGEFYANDNAFSSYLDDNLLPDTSENEAVQATTPRTHEDTASMKNAPSVSHKSKTKGLVFLGVCIGILIILAFVLFLTFGLKGEDEPSLPSSIRIFGEGSKFGDLKSSFSMDFFPDLGSSQEQKEKRNPFKGFSKKNSKSLLSKSNGTVDTTKVPSSRTFRSNRTNGSRQSFRSNMSALPESITRVSHPRIEMTEDEERTLSELM